ncbi:hypothetical protein C4569_03860 [Candidatus Parcubacteria bacterium]|nr:MAG: hypothetical protein C4569_03860 [Candidatus Parcubacteria bacterium]
MDRKRLTISIKKDLLDQVDRVIDEEKIRNRSHAIEYLLSKSLASKVSKALILAGGKGLKMRPLTYELPKVMLPISGKPLLEHTIDLLRNNEIRDITLSLGPLGEKVKQYFGAGTRFSVKIDYIEQEKEAVGTAQALLQVKEIFSDRPFILIYGDVLAEIDLSDMIEFHLSHKGTVTMALTSVEKSSDWGVCGIRGSQVLEFTEKPKPSKNLSHVINAGIYIMEPKIFNYINKKTIKLEKDVFPKLAYEEQIYGYFFRGKWFDVGNPKSYEEAVKSRNGK